MKGDVILRQGNYRETVSEERGSTRMILCFNFKENDPQPLKVRHYRIEYWEAGQIKRHTARDRVEALAFFHARVGGEEPDIGAQKRAFMLQLSNRVDRGLCVHCGTDKDVIRALCMECRALPQFQTVLSGAHMPTLAEDGHRF